MEQLSVTLHHLRVGPPRDSERRRRPMASLKSGNAKCSGNEGERWKSKASGAVTPLPHAPAAYTPTEETSVKMR